MKAKLLDPLRVLPEFNLSNEIFSHLDDKTIESTAEIVIRAWLESGQGGNIYSSPLGLDERDEDYDAEYDSYLR